MLTCADRIELVKVHDVPCGNALHRYYIANIYSLDGYADDLKHLFCLLRQAARSGCKLKGYQTRLENPLDNGVYASFDRGDHGFADSCSQLHAVIRTNPEMLHCAVRLPDVESFRVSSVQSQTCV